MEAVNFFYKVTRILKSAVKHSQCSRATWMILIHRNEEFFPLPSYCLEIISPVLCLFVLKCVYMRVLMHVYECTWRSEDSLGCHLKAPSTSFKAISLISEVMVGRGAQWISLPVPLSAGITNMCHHAWLF